MFSSKKDDAPMTTQPQQIVTPTPVTPRPGAVRSNTVSVISSGLTITGTLTSAGDMQIDGTVEGDLRCVNLVIGEAAIVKGEVVAEEVVVKGRVEGSIRARKVQLSATSKVDGNILHETFAVESGALFEGNCRHSDNPLAEESAPKLTSFARKTPAPSIAADVTKIDSVVGGQPN